MVNPVPTGSFQWISIVDVDIYAAFHVSGEVKISSCQSEMSPGKKQNNNSDSGTVPELRKSCNFLLFNSTFVYFCLIQSHSSVQVLSAFILTCREALNAAQCVVFMWYF